MQRVKKTKIRLELLTDPDMLIMFEHGIKGGITQVVHQYASANNKYMGKKFNPKEESRFLQYLDMNNQYGWAMSQLLPAGWFKWIDSSQFTPNDDKGNLLKVDVKNYMTRTMTFHSCTRRWKLTKSKSYCQTCMTRRITSSM